METDQSRTFRAQLRQKLPELVLEAISVVFAVLLALAVDQWREARRDHAEASRAQAAILSELAANREDLRQSLAENRLAITRVRAQADSLARSSGAHLSVGFSAAQLSSSAWTAVQANQATQLIDLQWLLPIARVYDLQALYTTSQTELLQRLADLLSEPTPEGLRAFATRLSILQSVGDSLEAAYARPLQLSSASAP